MTEHKTIVPATILSPDEWRQLVRSLRSKRSRAQEQVAELEAQLQTARNRLAAAEQALEDMAHVVSWADSEEDSE